MNIRLRSVGAFFRQQRFSIAMLLALAATIFFAWRWLELRDKTIWMGEVSPSGEKFITYTYNLNRRSGWKVSTHVRDVESGKVLHDLSRFHFSWLKSITWANESTLVGTVIDNELERLLTIRLDEELTILDQKDFANQKPMSLCVTSDGKIAFTTIENDVLPHYVEIATMPLVSDGNGDQRRVLSRIECGSDETASSFRGAMTVTDTIVVAVSPKPGAIPTGDFALTDGVSDTLLFVDLETGEVMHEVPGGYESIPNSNDYLAKKSATGIDVYRIDNVSESVANFSAQDAGQLAVLAYGPRWKVIQEELSHTAIRVIDANRNTKREFQLADWRAYAFLSGSNLFAMSNGKLERIDLEQSDHRKELVHVRRFLRLYAAIALLGIPLFILFAGRYFGELLAVDRSRPAAPIAERISE